MKRTTLVLSLICLTGTFAAIAFAQQHRDFRPPRPRTHSITTKGVVDLVPASSKPDVDNEVTMEVVGDQRFIVSNGIPNHNTGVFPNPGNPNRMSQQSHRYRVPANPVVADHITPMHGEFGVAINGVPFDPGAGEFFAGEPGWQYEPLSGAIALGIDVSHAHVQPTGKYHYHGLPTGLIDSVKVEADAHSPLIGWAADGFPMYAVYGYRDAKDATSAIQKLRSSYRLKPGQRPGGNAPGGTYDGTFVADYQYIEGSGDLDPCNGRHCVTPEFPDGTYAYFLTEDWPVVPRNFRGTPSEDFRHGPGPGGMGRDHHGRDHRGPEHSGPEQGRAPHPGPPHDRRLMRGPPPPKPGEVLPPFLKESMDLSEQQLDELDTLQSTVDKRLGEILNDEQMQRLREPGPGGHRDRSGPPRDDRRHRPKQDGPPRNGPPRNGPPR